MAASDSHPYTPVYPGPNDDLLEAQARVCTGPHQTRPLGVNTSDYPQPEPLLKTLLKSITGELPESDAASAAQMGAFFAAMTLRAYFPPQSYTMESCGSSSISQIPCSTHKTAPTRNSIPHEARERLCTSKSDRGNCCERVGKDFTGKAFKLH